MVEKAAHRLRKVRKNKVHLAADLKWRKGHPDGLFLECRENEEVLVPLGAAGSRGSSEIVQQLLVHNELTFFTEDTIYCLRMAVANAIAIADGHGATGEMLELEDIPDRSWAAEGARIRSASQKYSLRKIQGPDWQETHEYLLAQKSGICLPKVEGSWRV